MKNVNQKKLVNFRLSDDEIEKLNALAKKYKTKQLNLDTPIWQDQIRAFSEYTTEEIWEALESLKIPVWANENSQPQILEEDERLHFKEEYADAVHFYFEMMFVGTIRLDHVYKKAIEYANLELDFLIQLSKDIKPNHI